MARVKGTCLIHQYLKNVVSPQPVNGLVADWVVVVVVAVLVEVVAMPECVQGMAGRDQREQGAMRAVDVTAVVEHGCS